MHGVHGAEKEVQDDGEGIAKEQENDDEEKEGR